MNLLIDKITKNQKLSLNENSIILELGCQWATNLFEIQDSFPFVHRLIGIDNNKKSVCEYSNLYTSHFNNNTVLDSIDEYVFETYSLHDFDKLQTIEEFKEKIKIRIFDASEYLMKDCKYDLIILSDFLHMYNSKADSKAVFDLCKEKLSNQGIIYLLVANEEHPYKNKDDRIVFNQSEILDMTKDLNQVYFKEEGNKIEAIFFYEMKK